MFYRLTLMALGLVASCSHPKQPSEAMKETVSTCETANDPSSMMACGDRPGEERILSIMVNEKNYEIKTVTSCNGNGTEKLMGKLCSEGIKEISSSEYKSIQRNPANNYEKSLFLGQFLNKAIGDLQRNTL